MPNATKTVIIPTNPNDLKEIKKMVQEGADCLLRIDAEREMFKDIVDQIKEKYDIPKAYASDMIRREHKGDFDEKATKFDDFTALWTAVKDA